MIIVPLTRSVNKQKTLVRLQIVHSSYGLCLRMINQITITGYSFALFGSSRLTNQGVVFTTLKYGVTEVWASRAQHSSGR